ncbi:MAG: TatD family hydrolase, partial [Candidatus Dormibacteraceae bacterium]
MNLIDTHIHLERVSLEEGREGVEAVMSEARAVGVTDVIAMAVDGATCRQVVEWSDLIPGVWAAIGHHPENQSGPELGLMRKLACLPQVVAIGEIGLDAVDEHRGPMAEQLEWFRSCCQLARELDLPICVHIRGTEEAVYSELSAQPGLRGVIHYWSLSWEWAERFLELGFYISFAGTLTRASKVHIREVASRVPSDRLLLETDAPWGITRGRSGRMRPAWMVDTAMQLAELRGLSLADLAALERANAGRLFTRL